MKVPRGDLSRFPSVTPTVWPSPKRGLAARIFMWWTLEVECISGARSAREPRQAAPFNWELERLCFLLVSPLV